MWRQSGSTFLPDFKNILKLRPSNFVVLSKSSNSRLLSRFSNTSSNETDRETPVNRTTTYDKCYEFIHVPPDRRSGRSVIQLGRISLRFDNCRCCSTHRFIRFRPATLPARVEHTTSEDVFDIFHSREPMARATTKVAMYFPASPPAVYPDEFRTIDGSRNAPGDLGKAGGVDLRNTTIGYADGLGTPGGATRKGAREISNLVNFQTAPIPNQVNVSGFVWNWGNIVDHDMVLTKIAVPSDHFDIPIPPGDPVFDPKRRAGTLSHAQPQCCAFRERSPAAGQFQLRFSRRLRGVWLG